MQLYFSEYGKKESSALLILHGLLGSADNWHSFGKIFGEYFHTYTLDARNHGRSPHSEVFNYQAMAEDVVEFIEQNKLKSVYLLGHSMGGKTAAWTALQHPELVEKLIVVDIAPRSYQSHHDYVLEALTTLDLSKYEFRKDIEDALSVKITEPSIRQFLMKNLNRNANGKFTWKLNLDVIQKNYSQINQQLPSDIQFNKPVLFIRGEKSEYIEMEDLYLIVQLFPKAEIVTIKNAGHWVHADAPEEFSRNVIEFLLS